MNDNNNAIVVNGVYKSFKLPHEKVDSLKGAFVSMLNSKDKNAEKVTALRGISFNIKKGEFFGVVGRNGSGKSTLLKILANIYQPTKGQIITNGKLVPFIELGVGFNPELTGKENIYLNGAMLGFSVKEVREMYEDIVSFAELEKFMDQKLKNYSSGMQVRLAFSMATRSNADILLVDEVLAVGDGDFQRKCYEYFRELKKNKKTVVFVSHDMNSVREYCDRAILIENGKILIDDISDNVAKEYTRLFIPKAEDSQEEVEGDTNVRKNKWGAGGVDIQKIKLSKKSYDNTDEFIEATFTTKVLRDFPDGLIVGIVIKDDSGRPICGTNSQILQIKNITAKKEEAVSITWRIPNIFNDGSIIIEPGVSNGTNGELCQWWNNAATVLILNEEKTPYPVAPKITMQKL